MGLLDKFLRMAKTRYPDAEKLNRVMGKVGKDIERRAPLRYGGDDAQKMFNQRDDLYGRFLYKKI